ncbi:MAG: 23S rRNA (uracil(1939)-C(5))-methyltransferase RlmD, partial [Wenzhouxiangellaceae bacterium]|nr:23S rRNA (uracil(1939)-C(5))-methyltransferase RlmD [Wenzhouxiangellaceae bacterium]
PWRSRRRARLSARLVHGKGRVLVGVREVGGRYVADIERCDVLDPAFSDRLMSLSDLVGSLSTPDRIPQIECAAGDEAAAIVVRHLEPLTEDDLQRFRDWSDEAGIAVYLQPKGPDTVHLLHPEQCELTYRMPDFDLEMAFHPQHFIQVNAAVNRRLVAKAVELMAPGEDERILDLFCGLGNFSLPLARRAGLVVGAELEPALVEAARANASRNGLEDRTRFLAADLMQPATEGAPWVQRGFDGVLVDPPRSGAAEILPLAVATGAQRIVYVSCDPATLARDAGTLVRDHGFRLESAGIADMFPHTAHVESIALFRRAGE